MSFLLHVKAAMLTKSVAVGAAATLVGAGVAVAAPGSPVSFVTASDDDELVDDTPDADTPVEDDGTDGDGVEVEDDGVEDDGVDDDGVEDDGIDDDGVEDDDETPEVDGDLAAEEAGTDLDGAADLTDEDEDDGKGSAVSQAVHDAKEATPPGPARGKAVSQAAREANGSWKGVPDEDEEEDGDLIVEGDLPEDDTTEDDTDTTLDDADAVVTPATASADDGTKGNGKGKNTRR